MGKLVVIDLQKKQTVLEVTPGRKVMEAIRDSGADDLLALCGGCCSCGTCHVYVDAKWRAALPPVSANEQDLLDSLPCREPASRLSCQIEFDESLSGLTVEIAPRG